MRELYDAVCRLEEEKYDWEGKLGRQTEEVSLYSLSNCSTSDAKMSLTHLEIIFLITASDNK